MSNPVNSRQKVRSSKSFYATSKTKALNVSIVLEKLKQFLYRNKLKAITPQLLISYQQKRIVYSKVKTKLNINMSEVKTTNKANKARKVKDNNKKIVWVRFSKEKYNILNSKQVNKEFLSQKDHQIVT